MAFFVSLVRRLIKAAVRRSLLLLSAPIKRSAWYRSQFIDFYRTQHPNNDWYRVHLDRNYDIVVLGSSSAKWAFDFSSLPIKGMNWAEQPQLLADDFNLLKNYHSILRKSGFVVITLLPFSSLNKPGSVMQTFRYLRVFQNREDLLNNAFASSAIRYETYPILLGKAAIKAGFKCLLNIEKAGPTIPCGCMVEHNDMSDVQLENDALAWISGWKTQFRIPDLEYSLTPENAYGRQCKVMLVRNMIDFCLERGYRPIIVIPPVSKYLAKYFNARVKEVYIGSFLRELKRDIPIYNYMDKDGWDNANYYFNSFFLNKRGREVFTAQFLKDIGL